MKKKLGITGISLGITAIVVLMAFYSPVSGAMVFLPA